MSVIKRKDNQNDNFSFHVYFKKHAYDDYSVL